MYLSGTEVLVGLGKNRFVIIETVDRNVRMQHGRRFRSSPPMFPPLMMHTTVEPGFTLTFLDMRAATPAAPAGSTTTLHLSMIRRTVICIHNISLRSIDNHEKCTVLCPAFYFIAIGTGGVILVLVFRRSTLPENPGLN